MNTENDESAALFDVLTTLVNSAPVTCLLSRRDDTFEGIVGRFEKVLGSMMATNCTEPLSLTSRVRWRAVGEDGVVVHLERGRVLVVNEVGLRIVELLGEPGSRTELAKRLSDEFNVAVEQAESDLAEYLEQLDREQVLQTGSRTE